MANLKPYYEIIETCIKESGKDPVASRGELDGQWNLSVGSAKIWIDVWEMESSKQIYFQLLSPVVAVPTENREAFYQEILQINHTLYGVAFTVKDNFAYIKMIREAQGLDKTEAAAMIDRIGYYADLYDDQLKDKYFK